jgi:hypothetical protein
MQLYISPMTLVNTDLDNRLRSTQVLHGLIILFLAIICWITHFWDISHFGLYEDDYNFVGQPISTNFNGLIELVTGVWLRFNQGRPLGFSCAYILSFIGFNLAGMTGVYCCGYLILLTNTLLFYWLMWRLSQSRQLATIGGLAFCLFPADTTATFLTHSLGLYCCITFFILATHAYISDRHWLAYVAITASLISYETCFPLFLVVPLLRKKSDRSIQSKLLSNGLILAFLLATTIVIRKLVGESRMVELNPLSAMIISISHVLIGPFVSLGMYLYRPIYTIVNWQSQLFIFVPLSMVLIWSILWRILSHQSNIPESHLRDRLIPRSQLWLVGTSMLFLAYPLTIILQAGDIDGRASRVHLAAIIGGSMLCALGGDRLLSVAKTNLHKRLVSIGLATIFALLVGFGLIVQNDYRLAWQKQQNLITSITKLCPDMEAGTSIFVDREDLHNPTQIMAYSWSMPILLERIYEFPRQWQVIPHIYPLYGNWQKQIDDPNLLPLSKITEWLTFIPKQHPGSVKTQDVIMLKMVGDRSIRLDRLSLKNGITLNFKPQNSQSKLNFPTRPLYRYLVIPNLEITKPHVIQ